MRITLANCENTLIEEIARKKTTQRDVAQTYRLAMESHEFERIDWGRVNTAIIERWSKSGLLRIKTMAHSGKCFATK